MDKAKVEGKVVNLGWANGWQTDPELLVKCRAAGHQRDSDSDYLHCVTTVWCDKCKFIYKIDSSD
jgi:hypothetical protein